jgi:hypothetical protein
MMQKFEIAQKAAQIAGVVLPEFFTIADGQLEGGALEMGQQDLEIIGIDVGVFRRAVEEVVGVLDDVLIERGAGGDKDGRGRAVTAAGAAGALPA